MSYTYPATVMTILGTIRDNPLGSAYANYSVRSQWGKREKHISLRELANGR